MERPPPPITVVVPGRGEQPSELLAVDPPPSRRAPLPLRERVTGAAATAVLLAGAGTVATDEPAPPPRPEPVVVPAPLVAARAVPLAGERFLERLELRVRRTSDRPGQGGTGDSGSPAVAEQVSVVGVLARGFVVAITGPAPPVLLARAGVVTALQVEVRVVDCSVDTQAPRRLAVQVVEGAGGAPETVDVVSDPGVVRALDRLVSRTCRRPRG